MVEHDEVETLIPACLTPPHHWVVGSPQPDQPTLPARCKKCGAERGFAPTGGQPASLTYGEFMAVQRTGTTT